MLICLAGLQAGKIVINTFTLTKIALVTFIIIAGLASWTASDYGLKVCHLVVVKVKTYAWPALDTELVISCTVRCRGIAVEERESIPSFLYFFFPTNQG